MSPKPFGNNKTQEFNLDDSLRSFDAVQHFGLTTFFLQKCQYQSKNSNSVKTQKTTN